MAHKLPYMKELSAKLRRGNSSDPQSSSEAENELEESDHLRRTNKADKSDSSEEDDTRYQSISSNEDVYQSIVSDTNENSNFHEGTSNVYESGQETKILKLKSSVSVHENVSIPPKLPPRKWTSLKKIDTSNSQTVPPKTQPRKRKNISKEKTEHLSYYGESSRYSVGDSNLWHCNDNDDDDDSERETEKPQFLNKNSYVKELSAKYKSISSNEDVYQSIVSDNFHEGSSNVYESGLETRIPKLKSSVSVHENVSIPPKLPPRKWTILKKIDTSNLQTVPPKTQPRKRKSIGKEKTEHLPYYGESSRYSLGDSNLWHCNDDNDDDDDSERETEKPKLLNKNSYVKELSVKYESISSNEDVYQSIVSDTNKNSNFHEGSSNVYESGQKTRTPKLKSSVSVHENVSTPPKLPPRKWTSLKQIEKRKNISEEKTEQSSYYEESLKYRIALRDSNLRYHNDSDDDNDCGRETEKPNFFHKKSYIKELSAKLKAGNLSDSQSSSENELEESIHLGRTHNDDKSSSSEEDGAKYESTRSNENVYQSVVSNTNENSNFQEWSRNVEKRGQLMRIPKLKSSLSVTENVNIPPKPPSRKWVSLKKPDISNLQTVTPKPQNRQQPINIRNSSEEETEQESYYGESSRYFLRDGDLSYYNDDDDDDDDSGRETEKQKHLNKNSKAKLEHVLKELVDSEESYSKKLKNLIEVYLRCLEDEGPQYPVGKLNKLFATVKSFYEEELTFLNSLKQNELSADGVALIFLKSESMFDVYSKYMQNLSLVSEHISEVDGIVSHKQKESCNQMTFTNNLLSPIQRLEEYGALLQQIQEELKKSGQTSNSLDSAIEVIKHAKEKATNLNHMQSIQSCPLTLFLQGSLIMKDSFNILKPKKFKSTVFLFENSIIFTKQMSANDKNYHQSKPFLYVDNINMHELSLVRTENPKLFYLCVQSKSARKDVQTSYLLEAETSELKNKWVSEIESKLWDEVEEIKAQQRQFQMSLQDSGTLSRNGLPAVSKPNSTFYR